jgi:endonuclease/exonuclease/phosphatase family metal-dependent hydrolase
MRLEKFLRFSALSLLLFPLFSNADNFHFKVLQLNTWMLKLPIISESVAKDLKARAKILPEVVAGTGADIIVMQEVWPKAIRKQFARDMKKWGYPYSASDSKTGFLRGVMGNGLMIVSKFPLDSHIDYMRFKEYTVFDEFFAYKGAIKTKVEIPGVGAVDLYDSHLGAVDFDSKLKEYKPNEEDKKTSQAEELTHWIETKRSENIQILSADLNSHYRTFEDGEFTQTTSPVYTLMTDPIQGMGLVDTYHSINGFPAMPDCTYCMDNVYAALGLFGNAPSEVEDYIFINPNPQVTVESSEIVIKEDLSTIIDPTQYGLKTVPVHISDHYGLLTTFVVHQ